MGNFSVLIVDSNSYYIDLFQGYLERTQLFSRYDIASDGKEALEKVYTNRPDLLVTSLVLEKIDGLGLIESIAGAFKLSRPKMIVISYVTHPEVVDIAINKGANLYFSKNIECELFMQKVNELMLSSACIQPKHTAIHSDRDIMRKITKEIQLIGLPASSMGFKYVRYAIKLVIEDDTMLESVMTRLYPVVANKFNTNVACVERNIRHSIESAWNHGSMSYIDKVFGYSIDADKGKPTNRAFIATIADRIRLHSNY